MISHSHVSILFQRSNQIYSHYDTNQLKLTENKQYKSVVFYWPLWSNLLKFNVYKILASYVHYNILYRNKINQTSTLWYIFSIYNLWGHFNRMARQLFIGEIFHDLISSKSPRIRASSVLLNCYRESPCDTLNTTKNGYLFSPSKISQRVSTRPFIMMLLIVKKTLNHRLL